MKSSCELIVLTADSSFVTIYCKDQKKLELLYQNAKDCGFKRIEYITDHNDARTGMHV
jgi:tRNA(Phe) wybutosine-synthesizing methylase Tyw3